MTGYEIYCFCRNKLGRNSPSYDTYSNSSEYGYYEMLHNWFISAKKFPTKEIKQYIEFIYCDNKELFDPYSIMDEQWEEKYLEWKRTKSTKALYFETVKKSFIFMTNFCIKNCITFDKYKKVYAIKHVRQHYVDEAVAVYLQFFDKNKMSKIDKILLNNLLTKYNNIVVRIRDPELNKLLASSYQEMIKVLEVSASSAEK